MNTIILLCVLASSWAILTVDGLATDEGDDIMMLSYVLVVPQEAFIEIIMLLFLSTIVHASHYYFHFYFQCSSPSSIIVDCAPGIPEVGAVRGVGPLPLGLACPWRQWLCGLM